VWTFPVLLDCRPTFLPRAHPGSLLLAPLGDGTVLSHLRQRLAVVTGAPPVILTRFPIQTAYEKAIREVCPDVEVVETLPAFGERFHTYEPSDRLLLADPTCFPLEPRDPGLARLNEEDDDPRGVKHLIAIQRGFEGTREYLDADASGRVRAIQRYYDDVTWPFGGGVACSLVPVASVRVSFELPLASLPRLRRVLASEGVPSRDLPLDHGAVNLETERGLLEMNERLVLGLAPQVPGTAGAPSRTCMGSGVRVDPSASIVGPVVLQDEVEVRENATLIGPAVLGRGSIVGPGATVAQCVIGQGQVVVPGATLRHRVYLGDSEEGPSPAALQAEELHSADSWETPALALSAAATRPGRYPAFKRAFDVCLAASALLLLSPLAVLLALLVKLESSGPVFFGHVREGMRGRPFRCWKFRTMVHGADQQQRRLAQMNQVDGPQFKVSKDPRRTAVGAWLSAFNLDELPQLWNVLMGQMSFVGPRPSPFRENQVCVPWREGRLSVRPGITGLWQICRHDRDKGDFHQWIYYDLLYVHNISLLLDLKILALTVVSFAQNGYIPISWLLPPGAYGERRMARRAPETKPALVSSVATEAKAGDAARLAGGPASPGP
jgi:lipopolysaccharide/colanic/teichoic acid biosynthesis glycosyltransferase